MTQNVELPKVFEAPLSGLTSSTSNWADDDDIDLEKLTASLAPLKHTDTTPAVHSSNERHNHSNNGNYAHHTNYNNHEVLDDDPHFNFKFAKPFYEDRKSSGEHYKYGHHVNGGSRYDGGYNNDSSQGRRRSYTNTRGFQNARVNEGPQTMSLDQKPVVVEAVPLKPKVKSNPFGAAKPVDQSKIELDLKKRLEKLSVNSTTFKLGDNINPDTGEKSQSVDKKAPFDWKTHSLLTKGSKTTDKAERVTGTKTNERTKPAKSTNNEELTSKQNTRKSPQSKPVSILKREPSATSGAPSFSTAVFKIKDSSPTEPATEIDSKLTSGTAQAPGPNKNIKLSKNYPKRPQRRRRYSNEKKDASAENQTQQSDNTPVESVRDIEPPAVVKLVELDGVVKKPSTHEVKEKRGNFRHRRRGRGSYSNTTHTRKPETNADE